MKKGSGNVFRDVGFREATSANLEARARLLILLEREIKRLKLSNREVARRLGVPPPRVSEILHGRIEKFSLDLLTVYLARLGKDVDFKLVQQAA